jgi:C4-dicarboxylate transporter
VQLLQTQATAAIAKIRKKHRTAVTLFGIAACITATTSMFLLWNYMLVAAICCVSIAIILASICLGRYECHERNIEEFEALKEDIEMLVERADKEEHLTQLILRKELSQRLSFPFQDIEERHKEKISNQHFLLVMIILVSYFVLMCIMPIFDKHPKFQILSFEYNILYSIIAGIAGVIDIYLLFFFIKRCFDKKARKMRVKMQADFRQEYNTRIYQLSNIKLKIKGQHGYNA